MPDERPGRISILAGSLAVVGVLGGLVGVIASLATTNDLLVASPVRTAALVTLAVVVVTLLLLLVAGKPSRRWLRTPYW